MRHDSYLPASPDTLQALDRMEYAIDNTIASPDVRIAHSSHPGIEFGRSRTGEGSSGGRKRGVV